ncbi:MAG TPA: hypothetical protein DCY10_05315 [Clostridiales bacterium]|nr:hypothetical protein [Clostridiales bacterium]
MSLALTYDEVKALEPCSKEWRRVSALLGGERGWNGKRIDAATARAAGCSIDDLVWVAISVARYDADVHRRLRLWMADCAAHVLHIYEKSETSDAPRNAIIAARAFARGEIDNAARAAASDAAWIAARNAAELSAARYSAYAAAVSVSSSAGWITTWDAARSAALDAEEWSAAWDAADSLQFDRLIERLSENEPDDWPLPEVETR